MIAIQTVPSYLMKAECGKAVSIWNLSELESNEMNHLKTRRLKPCKE